jgi:hypothetical protein
VRRIDHALEREHDRVGVERPTIVEHHARPQHKRPAQAVGRDLPRGREPGLGLGRPGHPAREALEQDLADLDRLGVDHADQVQTGDVGGLRDDEHPRIAAVVARHRPRVATERGHGQDNQAQTWRVPHRVHLSIAPARPARRDARTMQGRARLTRGFQ